MKIDLPDIESEYKTAIENQEKRASGWTFD